MTLSPVVFINFGAHVFMSMDFFNFVAVRAWTFINLKADDLLAWTCSTSLPDELGLLSTSVPTTFCAWLAPGLVQLRCLANLDFYQPAHDIHELGLS